MINEQLNHTERNALSIVYYSDREISTNQIALRLGVSPVKAKSILLKLKHKDLVNMKIGKIRTFNRNKKRVISQRVIFWSVNIKN